ncbi:MAG: prolipoprotein diacylglyceryl transferase family protein [Myxococcota bacterium]
MIAAIPFFQLSVYNLDLFGFSLPFDPWATLVCIGFVVGLEVARARGIKLGLDTRDVVDGAVFIVLMGFFVAHLFTVLFYYPERLARDGIITLFRVWEGFASTGGFVGAVIGAWLFYPFVRNAIRPLGTPELPKGSGLLHADVIMFGFPVGWFFGRMGCFSVHDHIGSQTTFFLAMDFDHGIGPWAAGAPYADGIRHELGFYEMLYMIPVAALFFYFGREKRPTGFFLGLFGLLYAPLRFVLDFLRNTDLAYQDARYFGLTPAQYGMIVMFLAAAGFMWWIHQASTNPEDPIPSSPPNPEPTP